jgi:AcrR family transcriptional regulator
VALLDVKQIAAEALALLDDAGVAGFTMRTVAKRLNVTPMALYHHVQDKAALATLVIEAAMAEFPATDPDGDWQEDMLAMARWMREFSRAHPAVAELRRKYQVYTPAMLRMGERWVQLWQQSGLDTERAMVAASLSGILILGFVSEEAALEKLDLPTAATLPALSSSAPIAGFDAIYELAFRAVIAGVHAQVTGRSV